MATVTGRVVVGDRRGRLLGFPTANLAIGEGARVVDGVWIGRVDAGRRWFDAAVSIGRRPTFVAAGGVRLLEAHLLDFEGDLYGRTVTVHLRRWLRPQHRFDATIDLVHQMHDDIDAVRRAAQRGPRSGRRATPERRADRERRSSTRRERLIAAAAQTAIERDRLSHAEVARLAGVPEAYLSWAYPALDELRAVAGGDADQPRVLTA